MSGQRDLMDALLGESQGEQLRLLSVVPPTLSLKDGVGLLSFEAISLSTYEAGKRMPTRYRWEGKTLRFEVSEHSLTYVKRTWPNVIVLKAAVSMRTAPPPPAPIRGQMSWRPRHPRFEWQQRSFDYGAPKATFAYLADMGTGKSKAGVDDAAFHFARGEIDRVLVIAPNGVHEQWIDDVLEQHWPLSLPIRAEAVLTGDRYQRGGKMYNRRPEFMEHPTASPNECLWIAVNIENLEVKEEKRGGRKYIELIGLAEELVPFLEAGPAMIILDESHKIKNPNAKRTKACWKLGRLAKFRRIMTGTPIAKGLEDYYAQFRFLDPGIIGVWSMAGFKQQFCIMGGYQNNQIIGYRETADFHERIAPYSFRVKKEEVLDLPPKLYSERLVELTPQQRKMYRELRDELMTQLSDGSTITAGQVVEKMLRLQQITQGFLPLENGGFERIPNNRITGLLDLLEQAPDRVIIWARFREDITRIIDELGDEAVRYDGENQHERGAVREKWTRHGARFFVGNAQAGGTGLDWINGASTVIYYSNSFSSLDRWQSEDRTHRYGTRGVVNYYDMICKGTLDRAILRNLRRKRDVSDMSLQELKDLLEFG